MLPDSTSALLLLNVILVHSSVPSCRTGTLTECDAAPFVPGHNLVGPGFDLVRQQKKANVIDVKTYLSPSITCKLCTNPFQNNALQKLPSSVLHWISNSRCSDDIQSELHTSLSSLVEAYTSQDTSDWTFGLDILDRQASDKLNLGATHSKAYKFASKRSKEDRYTFSTHSVACSHYHFIASLTPPLTLKFKKRLALLPPHYNSSTKNEYRKLIHIYGTHYARAVKLGGRLRRLISLRSCLSSMNGLKPNEIKTCLSMGVAVGLGKMKISSVPNTCLVVLKNHDVATGYRFGLHKHITEVSGGNGWLGKFSIVYNDSIGYMNWLKSLKGHPDVVSYSLRPLYLLMPNERQKAAVKVAIVEYLKETAVKKSPQEPHCEGNIPNVASNCCPQHAARGNLSVTIIQAWKLYGDVVGVSDSYAKLYYGSFEGRTHMIRSDDPVWNAEFNLGKVDTSLQMKIEVWDEDSSKYDDRLVGCVTDMTPGNQFFRCSAPDGNVRFKYTLTCDPHLTGEKCMDYKPSPLVEGN